MILYILNMTKYNIKFPENVGGDIYEGNNQFKKYLMY